MILRLRKTPEEHLDFEIIGWSLAYHSFLAAVINLTVGLKSFQWREMYVKPSHKLLVVQSRRHTWVGDNILGREVPSMLACAHELLDDWLFGAGGWYAVVWFPCVYVITERLTTYFHRLIQSTACASLAVVQDLQSSWCMSSWSHNYGCIFLAWLPRAFPCKW